MKKIKNYIYKHFKDSFFSGRTMALVLLTLIFCKQAIIYITYGGEITGGRRETMLVYLGFFGNDLIILGIVLFLVVLNMNTRRSRTKVITNIMSLILVLLFFIDMLTIYFFQSRISIFDLYGFFGTTSGQSFSSYIGLIFGCFILLFISSFSVSQRYFKKRKEKKRQIRAASRFFAIAVFISMFNFISYKNKDLVSNILTINIEGIKNSIFKTSFLDATSPNKYEDYFKNIKGKSKKLNVILVFAESFSTVDSKRSNGLYDKFPFFDRIQSNGITFTNFMANGCTSATSHIALLKGVEPRENPLMKSSQAYDEYVSVTDSLPVFFNKLNYQTTFISSVGLDFLNEYTFLSGLAFKTIIGEEVFKNKKKYVFNAAPDQDLYTKTLETVNEYKKNKTPYFVAVQTISSHKPYNTPYGKSEEAMFSYVDKSIYAFYQKLKKADFFKDGILVIVGDHRKMEAIGGDEFNKRGASSHSRALATVIGPGIKPDTYNSNIIQHTDIFNSLKYLIGSGEVETSALFNNIFNGQKNRERGVRYCQFAGNTYNVIKDNGDAYRLREDKDKPIINYINAFKIYQAEKLLGVSNFSGYRVNMGQNSGGKIITGENSNIILIAHAGGAYGSGLTNAPESFQRAQKDGADGIEFDISYTKDDKNVVLHGPNMNTTICEKQGKNIATYTRKEIQEKCLLKNGEEVPSLEEFLKQVRGKFNYYFLEIKVYDEKKAEKQTLDAIDTVIGLGMEDRVIFISYDRIANYIIGSHKKIRAGRDSYYPTESKLIIDFPHEFYLLDHSLIEANTAEIVKEMNKKFVSYTINTKEEYDRAIKLGAKRMLTDNIPLLKALRSAEVK